MSVGAEGPAAQVAALRRAVAGGGVLTNRDTARMTTLMMTGVTALSRTIAARMEAHGVTYPAAEIRDVLRNNDLLHISNEVSFTDECPGPQPGTRFCSDPSYIDLLRDVGTDIVELSGNHNLDWGPEAARRTLRMYKARGWRWFAGGIDHVQAHRPLTITRNGNRLAFLGCNPVGASYAWADAGHPGSATCDLPAMERQIRDLRARGYLPITTFQHWETYQYSPDRRAGRGLRGDVAGGGGDRERQPGPPPAGLQPSTGAVSCTTAWATCSSTRCRPSARARRSWTSTSSTRGGTCRRGSSRSCSWTTPSPAR